MVCVTVSSLPGIGEAEMKITSPRDARILGCSPAAIRANAAAVLVVPGILAVRGRWHLLRTNAGLITVYGIASVAGAQLC